MNFIYKPNWFPLLYCRYAATKSPANVTGINPSTMPNNKGSIILVGLNGLLKV
jgi:hypothetical protein